MTDSNTFSIMRRLEIDAAHRVPHHASKCFNIHGHRYVIEATCKGELITGGEQRGMVMDFGFLKDCMIKAIHDPCDHGTIFWQNDSMLLDLYSAYGLSRMSKGSMNEIEGWKILIVENVPTAENLAEYWYWEVQEAINNFFDESGTFPPRVKHIDVWETPNCKARYPS